ncbi:hypothetical protein B0H17DRAFT_1088782 [Mycena rosella]|uniref:Uncharacterized protein n=1 Tax=Mycena rosella TaxID=1033263 RepID=A0AAD7CXV5_MYCRO|nr:hypothetical protein B0H17DRAFT_1088782 [Mycena rosella]
MRESTPTHGQHFTPHLLEVLRLLNHHISPLPSIPPPTTLPTATASATAAATTPPCPATYASAARPSSSESPINPDNHTLTRSGSSRRSPSPSPSPTLHDMPSPTTRSSAKKPPTQVIVRFDRQAASGRPQPTRTSPLDLKDAVEDALRSCFDTFPRFLAGIQWSRNRNLILHPDLGFCTEKFIAEQCKQIWTVLRPLLGLAGNHPCPSFETDEKWHSVVFHGVPMLADHRPEAYTWLALSTCTVSEDMHGELMDHSVLCGLEAFRTRCSVAILLAYEHSGT